MRRYACFFGNDIIFTSLDENEVHEYWKLLPDGIRRLCLIMFKVLDEEAQTPLGVWIYHRRMV